MALLVLWCLASILVDVAVGLSFATPEKPLILNAETTPEKPLILNAETTPEKPLILNAETTPEKPLILNAETTPEKPLILNAETTPEKPLILNGETTPEKPIILNEEVFQQEPDPLIQEHLQKVKEQNSFEVTNPTHVNGQKLFESDMLLTPEQWQLMTERKAIADTRYRWPNGPGGFPLVPYMFEDNLVNQTAVLAGIAHWEQHTCIRFTPATNFTIPHLRFFKGNGCYSNVGMIFFWTTGQQISIGTGCTEVGTVAHEIGHSLGFHHEQSRSDRDDHVIINYANIISGKEGNFDKEADNNYSVPYDYTSDMHYGDNYFTSNGSPTMVTVNPFAQELIGQRKGLSHYDKLLANRMYPCLANWLVACNLTADPCKNKGYLGATCSCICPAGTSGTNCETVTEGYYDSFLSGCSVNVTTEGNITSPNYPNSYPSGLKCVKVITAPACYAVQLTFFSFELYNQSANCNNTLCCYFDSLEIRTSDPYIGSMYCGHDITAGQVFTSSTGKIILVFKTGTYWNKGWAASVSFIPLPNCTTTSTSTSTTSTSSTSTTTTTTPTTTTTTTPTTTSTTTTTTPTTTTSTSTTTSTTTPTTTTTTTPTTTSPTTTSTTTSTSTTSTPTTSTTTTTPTTTSTTTTTSPTTTTTTSPTTTSTTTSTSTTSTPTTTATTPSTTTTTSTTTPTTTTTTPTTTSTTTTTPTTTRTTTTTPTTTSTTTTTPTTTRTTTTTPTTTRTTTTTPTTTSTTSTPTTTRTTTTTPTTTRTTTSTPTTTRTTTTTPTTTRTTTTRLSNCSTTTIPTTITPAPQGNCILALLASGSTQWISPNYPQNYPNNALCTFGMSSSTPQWASVQLNYFFLEFPWFLLSCRDFVSFTQIYILGDRTLCGSLSGTFNLPTYNFRAKFQSNALFNFKGFNITITPKSSKCHLLITTGGVGSTGNITAVSSNPSFMNTGCEWWIVSPPCTSIKLKFITTSLNGFCLLNGVLVNKYGDKTYPPSSTQNYCGPANPPTVTSVGNKLNVLFYSTTTNRPLLARWTVV